MERYIERFLPRNIKDFGRVILSVVVLSGAACSEVSGQAAKSKCPATAAEVSHLVGGRPDNWSQKRASDSSYYWFFQSDVEQVLNGVNRGRLHTRNGLVSSLSVKQTKEAWYTCIDYLSTGSTEPESQVTPQTNQ